MLTGVIRSILIAIEWIVRWSACSVRSIWSETVAIIPSSTGQRNTRQQETFSIRTKKALFQCELNRIQMQEKNLTRTWLHYWHHCWQYSPYSHRVDSRPSHYCYYCYCCCCNSHHHPVLMVIGYLFHYLHIDL